MDYEAEFMGNTEDMFPAYFGQDDYFSLSSGELKSHASIENVLVEKFSDYGVTAGAEIDTDFEGAGSLFDNEWMTAKINFSSCFSEEFDSNFNLVGVPPEEIQSMSVGEDLLDKECTDVEKLDLTNTSSEDIDEPISDNYVPVSPEQHVPDVDSVDKQFEALLGSYLAAVNRLVQDTSPDDLETTLVANLPLKRKAVEATEPSPKAKVKTPEQKQRKKLQNRNAATKYRSKKRNEQEALNAKCVELESENAKLRKKVEDKRQEVQYLKTLIIDVFNKKATKV